MPPRTAPAPSCTPTPTEIALGTIFGPYPDAPPLPQPRPGVTPRQALEEEVLAALTRPPCGVSFSGGRDSSMVLALATHVARREGLPLPVPLTHVFPAAPRSHETQWQELVIRSLDLPEWVRLTWQQEMDILGPFSTAVLRRVGVLDPFNAFFHEPLCAQVRGGSLLTGIGGDEVFGGVMQATAFRIRHRRRRPSLAQLRPLAMSYAPRWVRARQIHRRLVAGQAPWMRPAPGRAAERALALWMAADPLAWDASVRRFWGSRECHLGLAGLDALAREHEVAMGHPLNSPGFLAAMIAEHGHAGPGGRERATRVLAGDLLPAELVRRPDKAAFEGAFWTGANADFPTRWSGAGVDPAMVDIERLRAEWARPQGPHFGSLLLMQQAWLHDDRAGRAGS